MEVMYPESPESLTRVVADVWEKDVRDFQTKSGSSGTCRLFFRFLGKISEGPKCGSGCKWDLGAQGRNAKALARNNAPGGSMAHATRGRWKDALPNSEALQNTE